jgi:hypothetical protein
MYMYSFIEIVVIHECFWVNKYNVQIHVVPLSNKATPTNGQSYLSDQISDALK